MPRKKKSIGAPPASAEGNQRNSSIDLVTTDFSKFSPDQIHNLVHELHVHQIELETQNEELGSIQIALQESKDKFMDLYDFAPVGYLTWDAQTTILETNTVASRLLGLPKKGLIGKRFSQFIHHSDVTKCFAVLTMIAETRSSGKCEVRMIRFDGAQFHAQLEIVPDKMHGGATFMRAAMFDISDRKHWEQQVREHDEIFRSLFDNSLNGIVFTTDAGWIIRVNVACCNILKVSEAEIRSQNIASIVHKDAEGLNLLRALNDNSYFSSEIYLQCYDGALIPVELTTAPYKDSQKK